VRFDDKHVSNNHCKVFVRKIKNGIKSEYKVFVKDLISNGTYVNKVKVGKTLEKELESGDELSLAAPNTEFETIDVIAYMYRSEMARVIDNSKPNATPKNKEFKKQKTVLYISPTQDKKNELTSSSECPSTIEFDLSQDDRLNKSQGNSQEQEKLSPEISLLRQSTMLDVEATPISKTNKKKKKKKKIRSSTDSESSQSVSSSEEDDGQPKKKRKTQGKTQVAKSPTIVITLPTSSEKETSKSTTKYGQPNILRQETVYDAEVLTYVKPTSNKPAPPAPPAKPVCKYGAHCYRKNPVHLQEFYHPA